MALDGISGIRLTDIYGYDHNDYLNYVDNNMETINTVKNNFGYSTTDDAAADMYLNNLIKKKVGIDGFNANARNLEMQDRLAYYNSLFDDVKESERTGDTDLVSQEYDKQFTDNSEPNLYELWLNGDINPSSQESPQKGTLNDWFKYQADESASRPESEETQYVPYHPLEDSQSFPNISKILENVNKLKEKEEDFELQVFDRFYNPKYTLRESGEFNGTKIQKDIENYSKDIRSELDLDPEFTYNLFNMFERDMMKTSQYYRNYHDSTMMPYTPNEMKDILSTYYSIKALKGPDEAEKYALQTFQNKVSAEQGFWDKFGNGWKQGAANFLGSTISAAGIVGNTIPAIILASSKDHEIDDANWIQEVLFYAADNDLTKYGNDCITTGTWSRSLQEQYKERDYNPNANVREFGNEAKFLDWNTAFDIMPQMAFTVAGMWQGQFANMALKGIKNAAINPVTRRLMTQGATRFAKTIGEGIDLLADGIVFAGTAALPAASEASVDGLETYDYIKSQSSEGVNNALQIIVKEAMENGEFQDFYNSRTSLSLPSPETAHEFTPEEIDYINRKRNEDTQKIYNEFVEMKRQELITDPEFQSVVENVALRQAAKNLTDEAMYIAFGDMLFTRVLGGGFKASKKLIKSRFGTAAASPYKTYRTPTGAIRAAEEGFDWWEATKGVVRGAKEATEEGVEEGFQTVDTEARKSLADNYVTQWLLNRHNIITAEEFNNATSDEWAIINKSVGENIWSDETRYSFLMGAVSAGFGSPTVANGIRHAATSYVNGQATTFKDIALDFAKNAWRSPILEGYKEAKADNLKRQSEINDVNRWLEEHDEVAKMQDFFSIYSWAKKQEESAISDDEKDYRDAIMGQKVATLFMMDRIKGSAKEKSFSKKLREMTKLQEGSDAANSVVDQALAIQGIENATEEQRHKVFEDIVSKAKDLFELQKDVHQSRRWIQSNFGEILDSETVDAWAYETMMHQDIYNRAQEIDKFVKDSYNTSQNAKRNPREASPMDNFIAKYGSVENARKELSDLQKELSDARSDRVDLKRKLGTFGYRSYKSTLKDKISNLKTQIKEFEETGIPEGQVVLAENIASLSIDARAALLDEKNAEKHSSKQLNEIRKFKETQKIDQDVLDSIQDAAALMERYNSFSRRFKDVQKDAQSAMLYNNEVHREVITRMAKDGLRGALNAEDYESFKKAVDTFRNNPKNEFAAPVISSILKDNEFYKDYIKELNERKDALSLMNMSNVFKDLSDNQKRLLTQAYTRALQDQDTSFGNVLKYINDQELASNLNINTNEITDDFTSKISEILTQINNHKKNTEQLERLRKNLKSASSEKAADNPVPTRASTSKILNTKYYDSHRDNLNRIISNIHKYLIGKKKSIALSQDDYASIMSLFSDDEIGSKFLFDIKPTDLSFDSSVELLDKLQQAIDQYKMSHSDENYGEDLLNTIKLFDAIKKYVTTYTTSRLKSGVKIGENDFLRALLSQLTPELSKQLGIQKKTDITNIGSVNIKIKLDKDTSTESEKEYYKNNNVEENIKTLQQISRTGTSPTIILINDTELSNSILSETKQESFDSDDLPLVAAAIVPRDTKNSKVIDGQNVIILGTINQSRKSPQSEQVNSLNNLRQLVIDSKSSGVVKNVDGSIYQMRGIKIVSSKRSDSSISSVRDYLTEKFGSKEAALDAFKNGIAVMHLTKIADNSVEWSYQDPYTKVLKTGTYEIPIGSWDGRDRHTMLVYVDKDDTSKRLLLYERQINEVALFDDSEQGIYEVLNSGVDITSKEYKDKDVNNIRNAINNIKEALYNNIGGIIQQAAIAKSVSKEITRKITENNLNFGKKTGDAESPNTIDVQYDKKSHTLSIYLNIYDEDSDSNVRTLLAQTDEITPETIKSQKTREFVLNNLAKDIIKNLMFNEDGSPRMNLQGTYPLVKLQANYNKAVNKDFDYADKLFNANIFYGNVFVLQEDIDSIDVNPTEQRKISANKRHQAKQELLKFIKGDRKPPADYIGVSDFIKDEDSKANKSKSKTEKEDDEEAPIDEENIAGTVAKSLGTSIDKLVRVFFQTGMTKEGVLKWMADHKMTYWVGFGSRGNEQFNELFHEDKEHPEKSGLLFKIKKFFEDRDEEVVTDELLFMSELEDEYKRTAKISGVPDIITIDKNGFYRIYDMKSFKYTQGSSSRVHGFNSDAFFISGLRSSDYKLDSWKKQLTIYKELIERSLGKKCVVSIGVIPINLDYKVPGGTVIGSNPIVAIDDRKQVFDMSVPIAGSSKMTPLHVNKTTGYLDFIQTKPIAALSTIGSTRWRKSSGTSLLSEIRKNEKDNNKIGHIQDVVVSGSSQQNEISIKDSSKEELQGLFTFGPSVSATALRDKIKNSKCRNK